VTPAEDRLRDLRGATRQEIKASPQLLLRIHEATNRPRRVRDCLPRLHRFPRFSRLPRPANPSKLAIVALAAAAIVVSVLVARHPFSPVATKGTTRDATGAAAQVIPSSFVYRDAGADPGAQRIALSSADGRKTVPVVLVPDGASVVGRGNLGLPPKNETYQLWGIIDGQPVFLRTLGSNPDFRTFVSPPNVTVLFITAVAEGDITNSGKVPVVAGVVRNTSMRSLVV
jgi:hypothetical protein